MFAWALTIFLGAFLLFQVQPLIGKYILPWFGGGPGVWTTSLLFFQMLLLGGYAYAHWTTRFLKPRAQATIHLVLLAIALALLPITPADSWKPHGDGNPTLQILALLTVCLGAPYFVLSSTGPLMQQWFARTNPGVSPYRLYTLSNVGSLLALVSYPFFVETQLTRIAQARLWVWGFGAFVLCCAGCAFKLWKANPYPELETESQNENPSSIRQSPSSKSNQLLWLLLPACASVLLLAVTNKICQDVAVIPFLWVLPLALYLLSFVICFDNPRWYARFPFALALIAALAVMCWALFKGVDASIRVQVGVYSAGLFVCCMMCHGELYRLKPDPRQLTGFYLMIAAGGALGGLFVAVVAPWIFTDYYELHWGLLLCAALFIVVCVREKNFLSANQWRALACILMLAVFVGLDFGLAALAKQHAAIPKSTFISFRAVMWSFFTLFTASWILRGKFRTFPAWRLLACLWLILGALALAATLRLQARNADEQVIARSRNFYGTLKVCEYDKSDPSSHYLLLQHGRITHGLQFVDTEQAKWPTTYYGKESGVGLALRALPAGARRVGLVGLGTGTIAAYGQAGDALRIYEINPAVQRLATSRFTYLSNCAAKVEVVLGDARLSLEREAPQNFDVLALDAFSSDAIPVHLLTKEAFELYARHLKPNGIIAVHISNHYLNLEPVVANAARRFNFKSAVIDYEENEEEGEWWVYASSWILLTRNGEILDAPVIKQAAGTVKTNAVTVPLWTDDFTSVFQILK